MCQAAPLRILLSASTKFCFLFLTYQHRYCNARLQTREFLTCWLAPLHGELYLSIANTAIPSTTSATAEMSAKKTGYPSEKGQVLRQLQNLSNASVPDTVLQGIAHYESTAGDTEKLFNSFTTQIAQIKAQLNNFRDGLNTVQVMQRENEETTRDFVQQFADLIVDYAIQKGVRVRLTSNEAHQKNKCASDA